MTKSPGVSFHKTFKLRRVINYLPHALRKTFKLKLILAILKNWI